MDKSDINDPMKMHKFQEKCERHCDKMEECNKGEKRLCTSLWGQCTETMKNEPKAVEKFEDLDDNQDLILSMENEKNHNSFQRQKVCI